jgi:uncharacterized membrane protein YdjX (TVP38/TMEM64 family)
VGVQTLVNLVAGMTQMPLRRYVPALVAGSLLWGLLYATVGFAGVTAWWQLYQRSPLARRCCWWWSSWGSPRTWCARSGCVEPPAWSPTRTNVGA